MRPQRPDLAGIKAFRDQLRLGLRDDLVKQQLQSRMLRAPRSMPNSWGGTPITRACESVQ
jgi:hypothetical protein